MTEQMTFTVLSDSQHGWIKVTPAQAAALGITHDDLTTYSYRAPDGTLYAEEDADAAVVMAAHHRVTGKGALYREVHGSPRSLSSCGGARADWQGACRYLDQHPDAAMWGKAA